MLRLKDRDEAEKLRSIYSSAESINQLVHSNYFFEDN
jgi:hypothetical protein